VPPETPTGYPLPIAIDREGSLASIASAVRTISDHDNVSSLLVWIAGLPRDDMAAFESMLAQLPRPTVGALFPKLIVGASLLERGAIVIGLPSAHPPVCIPTLDGAGTELEAAIARLPLLPPASLLLVMADGWSPRLRTLAHAVFQEFGSSVCVMGGGAGSLMHPDMPCVFTNTGLLANAALLLAIPWPGGIGMGLAHGWRSASAPFKVTASEGHIVREFDHEPAVAVYDRVLNSMPSDPRRGRSLLELLSRHPLGVRRLDADVVLRDPVRLTADGQGIVCLCEVPVGAFVHVMRTDHRAMVRAARVADSSARRALGQRTPVARFVFDCVSREAFLDAGIGEELEIFADGVPTVGALTIGEIASEGEHHLEYHNKSIVVTQLAGESLP